MAGNAQTAASKLKVFISYSRRDQIFVDNLAPALEACGFEPFYDREDIAPGEPWEERLDRLILAADTVAYVISPPSVKSDRCGWEVARTEHRGKRLLPLLLEPVEEASVPKSLSRLNWIMFNKPELFGSALGQLVAALSTDLEWVREHTRLGEIATRWAQREKPEALLIRSEELLDAEQWLSERPPQGLEATEAHRTFISASRNAEDVRRNKERTQLAAIAEAQEARSKALAESEAVQKSRARMQLRFTIGLAALAAVVLGGAVWAIHQIREVQRGRMALTTELAQQSINDGAYDRAARIALYGLRPVGRSLLGFDWGDPVVKGLEAKLLGGSTLSQLKFVLTPQPQPMASVIYRSDGRTILTVSQDGTVKTSHAETGKPLTNFKSDVTSLHRAVMSPNGRTVFIHSWEGAGSAWDTLKREKLSAIQFGDAKVSDAAFSSDSELLVVALSDGTCRVWNLGSEQEIARLGHEREVIGASFDPLGRRILAVSQDGTAAIWDVQSHQLVARLEHRDGSERVSITAARFSQGGEQAVTLSLSTAKIWDVPFGNLVAENTFRPGDWSDSDFAPDGKVVTHEGATAFVWDILTGRTVDLVHSEEVLAANFSRDGKRVLTRTAKVARLWDVNSATIVGTVSLNKDEAVTLSPNGEDVIAFVVNGAARDAPNRAARVLNILTDRSDRSVEGYYGGRKNAVFSPDGSRIVIAGPNGAARVLDVKSGADLRALHGHKEGQRLTLAIDSQGKKIVTASEDGVVRMWNTTSWESVVLVGHTKAVTSATFDPRGTMVVTTSEDATARLWDADSGKLLQILNHGNYVSSASFSRDSQRIVTASQDNTAQIWTVATGTRLAELKGHARQLETAVFSPDGTKVLTASLDHTARLWNAASGTELGRSLQHGGPVVSASFSRDGRRIVTASYDKTSRVWDGDSGKSIAVLRGHEEPVNAAEFSYGGEYVLTASQDKTVRLWDPSSGEQIAIIFKHNRAALNAIFSPDGSRVLTTSEDGTARLWHAGVPLQYQGEVLRDKVCKERLVGAQTITTDDAERYPALADIKDENVCNTQGWLELVQQFLLWPSSRASAFSGSALPK